MQHLQHMPQQKMSEHTKKRLRSPETLVLIESMRQDLNLRPLRSSRN